MAVAFRPDSGRAWIVLLASFVISFLTLGNALTLGVLFERIKQSFGGSNVPTTSAINLVFALNVAFTFLSGTIAAVVTAAVGYRWTMFLGAVLSCSGFALASVATELWHLYLTLGVMVGVGFGHLYTPSVGILTIFFQKYRHFAATISSTGVSAGIMAYAFLHAYFSRNFTWSTAMLIEAIICGQLLVCACLMFNPYATSVDRRRRKQTENGGGVENAKLLHADSVRLAEPNSRSPLRPARDLNELASHVTRYIDDADDIDVALGLPSAAGRTTAPAPPVIIPSVDHSQLIITPQNVQKRNLWHFEMFRGPKFYFLLIEALAIIGVNIFLVTTPAYLTESHNWSPTSAAFVLTVHGAASLVVRVFINALNAFPSYGDRISKPLQICVGILCIIVAAVAYMLASPPSLLPMPNSAQPILVTSQNFTAISTTTPAFTWEDAKRRLEQAESEQQIIADGGVPNDGESSHFFSTTENNMVLFLVFAAVDGIGEALFISYQASLLINIMGAERLTAAFGYLNFVWGLATLALYPVAGVIGDAFGSLRYAYIISIVCCAMSLCALLVVVVLHGRDKKAQMRMNGNSVRGKTPTSEISTVAK